jgi:hypothetical protein
VLAEIGGMKAKPFAQPVESGIAGPTPNPSLIQRRRAVRYSGGWFS